MSLIKLPTNTFVEVPDVKDTANDTAMGLLSDLVLGKNESIETVQTISMIRYADGTHQSVAIDYVAGRENNLRAVVVDITEADFNPFKDNLLQIFAGMEQLPVVTEN